MGFPGIVVVGTLSVCFLSELLTKHFTITGEKFLNALSKELVELSKKDLQWRYHTMVGALTFLMGSTESIKSGNFASRKENYSPLNIIYDLFAKKLRIISRKS